MLNFKKKKEIVYELKKKVETALSIIIASIDGIKSNTINQLRKEARDVGVYVQVVPNALLRRVVLKTPLDFLSEFFVRNSIIAFSTRNPGDSARIFVKFSKDYEGFKIKGAVFNNKLIVLDQINILANLPDHKESIIRLILALKISSLGKLFNILQKLSNREVKL